jgi:nucleoid-associated protein EbfC
MNVNDLMKAAQAMQSKVAEGQKILDKTIVTGESGGGLVKITGTARGKITAITIDPSLLVPADKEVLEDLVLAAITSTQKNGEEVGLVEMTKLTNSGSTLPGLR